MKKPESICVFGDSVSWGAWDTERCGWVNRLWLHVVNRKVDYVEIYNQSISGGTTETILECFEDEAKIRNADALIFQIGGNDSSYQGKPENILVQPEKFRKNIQEIIDRAKKITPNIIFWDLNNCDESKTKPVSWVDVYYTNERIKKYINITKEVCEVNNVYFLDVGLLDNKDFFDGLHPNTEGHKKVFERVKDFLVKNNWI